MKPIYDIMNNAIDRLSDTNKPKEYLFSDEVKFINNLKKCRSDYKGSNERYWKSDVFRFEWVMIDKLHRQKPLITTGIIIGVRILRDGHIVYESHDDGLEACFITDKTFKAYLVATDMKRNPVYVSPKDIL